MILPMMPIRYTNKHAIFAFYYREYGQLKVETVKVKLTDVINELNKNDKVKAINNINLKYVYPLYAKINNNNDKMEAAIFGLDMIETIVNDLSPLIGV